MWSGEKKLLVGGFFYHFPAGGELLHLTADIISASHFDRILFACLRRVKKRFPLQANCKVLHETLALASLLFLFYISCSRVEFPSCKIRCRLWVNSAFVYVLRTVCGGFFSLPARLSLFVTLDPHPSFLPSLLLASGRASPVRGAPAHPSRRLSNIYLLSPRNNLVVLLWTSDVKKRSYSFQAATAHIFFLIFIPWPIQSHRASISVCAHPLHARVEFWGLDFRWKFRIHLRCVCCFYTHQGGERNTTEKRIFFLSIATSHWTPFFTVDNSIIQSSLGFNFLPWPAFIIFTIGNIQRNYHLIAAKYSGDMA